jgi:hypothetical protein
MQFRFLHLMITVTVFCVVFGLVFASPPVLGFPILSILFIATPSICLTGCFWSKGSKRVFFAGGAASAFLPWFCAALFVFPEFFYRGRFFDNSFWLPAAGSRWVGVHIALVSPILGVLIGGGAALLTHRLIFAKEPPQSFPSSTSPKQVESQTHDLRE